MALAIDKFRQASPGSRKRTSVWLYGRLTDAIEISQMDVISSSVDKALTAGGEKVSGAQAELKRDKPPKQKPPKEEKPGKKENKPDKKGDKAGKEKPKKDEVDAAAADSKGKEKGRGKDKGKKEPLTKEEKSKRPCMYFAYDSCRKNPSAHVCTLLMIRVFMVRSASICMTKTTCTKVQSPEQSHQHQQALQPFRQQQQQQSQLQKPRLGKQRRSVGKFSKECPRHFCRMCSAKQSPQSWQQLHV